MCMPSWTGPTGARFCSMICACGGDGNTFARWECTRPRCQSSGIHFDRYVSVLCHQHWGLVRVRAAVPHPVHDAQMDEFLDAGLVGQVVIHESCHFGSRTVILPGVEVGPRTIVGANSVVAKSLPPDTVCGGTPAKVICTLDEYLARHETALAAGPTFPWADFNANALTLERRQELVAALARGSIYITGGFSEELKGRGGTARTSFDDTARPHGVEFLRRRRRH